MEVQKVIPGSNVSLSSKVNNEPCCNVSPKAGEKDFSKTYKIIKEAKDWVLFPMFLAWAGISIQHLVSEPKDENIKSLIKILDKDGDGKLSKEEIDEAKKIMEEVSKWRKANNQLEDFFSNFTNKKK